MAPRLLPNPRAAAAGLAPRPWDRPRPVEAGSTDEAPVVISCVPAWKRALDVTADTEAIDAPPLSDEAVHDDGGGGGCTVLALCFCGRRGAALVENTAAVGPGPARMTSGEEWGAATGNGPTLLVATPLFLLQACLANQEPRWSMS